MGLYQLCLPWSSGSSSPPPTKAKVQHISEEKSYDEIGRNDIREKLQNRALVGESLEFMKNLPSDFVDCTVTSPPYNKGRSDTYGIYRNDVPWDDYMENQKEVLNELYRITKPGGHLWYIHQVQPRVRECQIYHPMSWILDTKWTVRQEIIGGKSSCEFTWRIRFMDCDERIYWLRKEPGPPFELSPQVAKWGTIWRFPHVPLSHIFPHPCPCHIYLVQSILHATNLPNGSLIFDPYGGVGTTAKAAQIANHDYLTIDTDKKYVAMIEKRLRTTTYEDEWWTTLLIVQIANGTLDLSMSLKKQAQERIMASVN